MRELPRQLTVGELAALFNGRSRLVQALADRKHPLEVADDVIDELSEAEQVEALATHPRIGEASPEQSGAEPEVLEELERLNAEYERRFGFRFVVFVDRRPRAEIVPILRRRLDNSRAEELRTGLRELVAIARDRWQREVV